MRKLLFFIPAIVFTAFYGLIALAGSLKIMSPIVLAWLALLWIAGVVLCRNQWWGGLIGMVPGACFIYMGTQDRGQIFSETPIGIVIVLYYILCIFLARKKNRTKNG